MPGLHKMNCFGICFLKEQFRKNPSVSCSELKRIYNNRAKTMGWKILKSPGTVRYHLQKAGFKINSIRKPYNSEDMGEILMKHGGRRELAEKFNVSEVTVRDALKFRTHSKVANMLRKAALEMGGVLQGARTIREGLSQGSI